MHPPLSVVVAARNDARTLRDTLAAIRSSELPREAYELIVVDDGSTDESASIAARYADTVIRLKECFRGPAYSRNRGAELARGEFVAFVDADVIVRPDTLSGITALFAEHPSLDAISASRSSSPAGLNFVSEYWNHLQRFGETIYGGAAVDVASGCSLVRRSVLHNLGLYDEWRFGTASLEGLELGQRLANNGHGVALSRSHQVLHLKRWNVGGVFREVWNRSRILGRCLGYQRTRRAVPSEVVFTLSRTMTPALVVLTIVALSAAFIPEPAWAVKGTVALVILSLANLAVYRFLTNSLGLRFGLASAPLHLLAQGVVAGGLSFGWILRATVGDRSPDAATQAYSEVGLETWPPVPRRR